ncbi:hypothetical protein J1N35_024077 [Gossypium stocksii]|uniref:Uncharacterized protein n=1 Tax=Gossypium stocksii TaxID=47602 RepID=A0A9D3VKB6_9ROSI|nr:hypothetical protein J1N35_024077 [Gossypium stocksii]
MSLLHLLYDVRPHQQEHVVDKEIRTKPERLATMTRRPHLRMNMFLDAKLDHLLEVANNKHVGRRH